MDIFADVVKEHHGLLLNAVVRAASQLGVFGLYPGPSPTASYSPTEMAARLDLPTRRLGRLLDILVAEGILTRSCEGEPDAIFLASEPSWSVRPAGQWDHIADAIASDKPLDLDPAWLERHLTYVASRSEAVAPILWRRLKPVAGSRLLDLGGGLGAFSLSFLRHHPANSATLLDLPEVVDLLRKHTSALPAALTVVAGDARQLPNLEKSDIVLLANVLHLLGPEDCRQVVRNAVSALSPGGVVVIWDLAISPDRASPLASLYFALNMAIFTEAGDVHTPDQLMEWMWDAGLGEVTRLDVPECSASLCLVGTRQKA